MKYTIEGFNQEEILKLGNLDVVDLVILRWIVDFEPSMTKKEIDGETYFWVNYQSLLDALPILKLGKRSLYDRLMKMCDVRVLKHKNVKDNGNYSYYSFYENYMKLVQKQTSKDMKSTSKGYEDNFQTLMKETSEQNNSSIKEINLLNNSIIPIVPLTSYKSCEGITNSKSVCSKRAKLKIENLCLCGQHARMYLTEIGRTDLIIQTEEKENSNEELFTKFWDAYPRKVSKGNAEKWFTKNKPSEGLVNKMVEKISLLKNTDQWKSNNGQYIPYPTTWLNAKGWEDEIKQENKLVEEDIHDRARRIFGNN